MNFVAFQGLGLHSGERSRIAMERTAGPLEFVIDGARARLDELSIVRTDFGVSVRRPGSEVAIDLVEHLMAALGGLAIRSGVTIWLDGPEVPLLDGGAKELAWSLAGMGIPRDSPTLRVKKKGEVAIGQSVYRFEPAPSVDLEVEIDFDRAGIGRQRAHFDGSIRGFLTEIAPARTFGFLDDAELLQARGRARHVDPSSVIVFDRAGSVLSGTEPPSRGELARHKLLDMLGDLYLHGGPPIGRLHAERPGHSATHAAVRAALQQGTLVRS